MAQWGEMIHSGIAGWVARERDAQRRWVAAPEHTWEGVGEIEIDPADEYSLWAKRGRGILISSREGKTADPSPAPKVLAAGELRLEFCIPTESNSGVYLLGQYEIQIVDSHEQADDELTYESCGGIYARWDAEDEDAVRGLRAAHERGAAARRVADARPGVPGAAVRPRGEQDRERALRERAAERRAGSTSGSSAPGRRAGRGATSRSRGGRCGCRATTVRSRTGTYGSGRSSSRRRMRARGRGADRAAPRRSPGRRRGDRLTGVDPGAAPLSTATAPLTITNGMPIGNWRGSR